MRPYAIMFVAFFATAGLSSSASAQLKVGGGGLEVVGPRNPAAVAAADAPIRDMRKPGGHTLRCWQNGRLLYEGSGFRGNVANTQGISVARHGDGEPPVTVLNLNQAVCILAD